MQSLTVGELEVEIIPPKFRNSPGRRGSLDSPGADFRQTVNLTRMESFSGFDRASTYNASGHLDRPKTEVSSELSAYA
jgi:hypothetical protein